MHVGIAIEYVDLDEIDSPVGDCVTFGLPLLLHIRDGLGGQLLQPGVTQVDAVHFGAALDDRFGLVNSENEIVYSMYF